MYDQCSWLERPWHSSLDIPPRGTWRWSCWQPHWRWSMLNNSALWTLLGLAHDQMSSRWNNRGRCRYRRSFMHFWNLKSIPQLNTGRLGQDWRWWSEYLPTYFSLQATIQISSRHGVEQLTSLGHAPSWGHGSVAWTRATSDPGVVVSRAAMETEVMPVALAVVLAESLTTAKIESSRISFSLI